jgi:hypothetical protein
MHAMNAAQLKPHINLVHDVVAASADEDGPRELRISFGDVVQRQRTDTKKRGEAAVLLKLTWPAFAGVSLR